MKVCRERLYSLLRYGYKHDGIWNNASVFYNCKMSPKNCGYDLPNHYDVDMIVSAVELYEHISHIISGNITSMSTEEICNAFKKELDGG